MERFMVEEAVKESWEDECTRRIGNWHDQLRGLVDGSTAPKIEALQLLNPRGGRTVGTRGPQDEGPPSRPCKTNDMVAAFSFSARIILSLLGVLLGAWLKAY